jgi:hypothetical protein
MNPVTVVYVKDAPTQLQGAEFSLWTDAERVFAAQDPPYHRKQIIISNEARTAHVLHVVQESGESPSGVGPPRILTVFAGTNVTLFTSATVRIRNNGYDFTDGDTDTVLIPVRVTESFYI